MAEIESPMTANVWKVQVAVGDTVAEGDVVVILEAMKMEECGRGRGGRPRRPIHCSEGGSIAEGDVLMVLE